MNFRIPASVPQQAAQDPDAAHQDTMAYYDAIADQYHLFYRDWQAAMERDGATLRRKFQRAGLRRVLDASCGTGTQSIGLARYDFDITAADPNPHMLTRARQFARDFGVAERIHFVQAGFLDLPAVVDGPFDALVSAGNSLPHLLSDDDIRAALANFYDLLRPGGMLVIGIRDFELMLEDRPRFVPRQAHIDDPECDHILFDIWDWNDGPPVTVTFNTFFITGKGEHYTATRRPVTYRALTRTEMETMLECAGFTGITVESQGWELHFTARRGD
jgi:ubiquinone/menaquinone biosynthesis C-methylase UbiE